MKILEPFEAGRLRLKNRVVISSYSADHGLYVQTTDPSWYVRHLAERTDVGLVVLQCLAPRFIGIDPPHDRAMLRERFRRFGEALHADGTVALLQLAHSGPHAKGWAQPGMKALQGFSPVPSPVSADVAHAMDPAEIEALLEGFADLASIAVEAGLDGVELHGGNGHLLQQSLSSWMNFRTDEWGRPLAFFTEAARRVRAAVGEGIVGVRFPSDDHRPIADGGRSPTQLRELAVELAGTGLIDYLNPLEGSGYGHYYRSVGTYRRPHGDFLESTKAMRSALAGRVPVIGVGRIVTLAEAEAAVTDEACDLVAMTRAHIADPLLIAKFRRGDAARTRPCVGSNQGCLDRTWLGEVLTCLHNPSVGREHLVMAAAAVATPRRVLVVGAGPAGMKAAEMAARRGHSVTLFDARPRLGGRFGAITDAHPAGELRGSLDWIAAELELLGVTLRLGVAVDAEFLTAAGADRIVLATGSVPTPPPFPTDDSVPVFATDAALDRLAELRGRAVLVYDELGTEEASITWEQLAAAGARVTVVTPNAEVGHRLGLTHSVDHVERTLALGAGIEERVTITAVHAGRTHTRDGLTGATRTRVVDAIVLASPRQPSADLAAAARAGCGSVVIIGDAYSPRSALQAFREGHDAGGWAGQD